jgi:hypothetical protein
MIAVIRTYRDFREFLEAKRIKRESVRFTGHGVATARCIPQNPVGFEEFRESLRGVPDFARASERVDKLEHALFRLHGVGLPLPRKVLQNEDRSLSLFWESVLVRCFVDGYAVLIGGIDGVKAKRVTPALLDALGFLSRLQRAA